MQLSPCCLPQRLEIGANEFHATFLLLLHFSLQTLAKGVHVQQSASQRQSPVPTSRLAVVALVASRKLCRPSPSSGCPLAVTQPLTNGGHPGTCYRTSSLINLALHKATGSPTSTPRTRKILLILMCRQNSLCVPNAGVTVTPCCPLAHLMLLFSCPQARANLAAWCQRCRSG